MLFTIQDKTYRVSYKWKDDTTKAFHVYAYPEGMPIGIIDEWREDSHVTPQREPLDLTRGILKQLAEDMCKPDTMLQAMGSSES